MHDAWNHYENMIQLKRLIADSSPGSASTSNFSNLFARYYHRARHGGGGNGQKADKAKKGKPDSTKKRQSQIAPVAQESSQRARDSEASY
jgi:hypothetical protein